jgi:hypothetical protein
VPKMQRDRPVRSTKTLTKVCSPTSRNVDEQPDFTRLSVGLQLLKHPE